MTIDLASGHGCKLRSDHHQQSLNLKMICTMTHWWALRWIKSPTLEPKIHLLKLHYFPQNKVGHRPAFLSFSFFHSFFSPLKARHFTSKWAATWLRLQCYLSMPEACRLPTSIALSKPRPQTKDNLPGCGLTTFPGSIIAGSNTLAFCHVVSSPLMTATSPLVVINKRVISMSTYILTSLKWHWKINNKYLVKES